MPDSSPRISGSGSPRAQQRRKVWSRQREYSTAALTSSMAPSSAACRVVQMVQVVSEGLASVHVAINYVEAHVHPPWAARRCTNRRLHARPRPPCACQRRRQTRLRPRTPAAGYLRQLRTSRLLVAVAAAPRSQAAPPPAGVPRLEA